MTRGLIAQKMLHPPLLYLTLPKTVYYLSPQLILFNKENLYQPYTGLKG